MQKENRRVYYYSDVEKDLVELEILKEDEDKYLIRRVGELEGDGYFVDKTTFSFEGFSFTKLGALNIFLKQSRKNWVELQVQMNDLAEKVYDCLYLAEIILEEIGNG